VICGSGSDFVASLRAINCFLGDGLFLQLVIGNWQLVIANWSFALIKRYDRDKFINVSSTLNLNEL
jgi:hypothetical protein